MIDIAGDLDLLTAPILRQALHKATHSASTPLVLDMSRVAFMDPTGLRVLDGYASGGRLHLARPVRLVRRLLELTGYEAHVHDTVDDAVAAASQQPGLLFETEGHDGSATNV